MMSLSFRSRALCLVTLVVPVLMVLCLFAAEAQAGNSSEERAVLETVQRFFDAMTNRDAEAALEVTVPEGRFFSLREENGETMMRSSTNEEFAQGLETQERDLLERFWEAEVRIHGGIATVWTPYDFFLDGEFHHCGIDAFDLLNDGTGWKITGGVYTVETSGCPDSPLGPPAKDIE
ncbi:MAG: nuclear transport factor 2 family protein [Thermoanaerobaculia bacterium]